MPWPRSTRRSGSAGDPVARRVVYYVAASLDGFIADAGGGVGWLGPFEAGESDFGYEAFLAEVGDIAIGRRTYEQVLGFDEPYPYAGIRTWVASSDLTLPAPDAEATITDEPAEGLVARLKYSDAPGLIWVVGGGALAGSLFDAGLLDELRVFVIPLTVGSGVPMLGTAWGSRELALIESREWAGGVVELRYEVGAALERA
jgi:dihydrofolate reductase